MSDSDRKRGLDEGIWSTNNLFLQPCPDVYFPRRRLIVHPTGTWLPKLKKRRVSRVSSGSDSTVRSPVPAVEVVDLALDA
eukprot:2143923-Pyramimonas_sp.AAC.1